MICHLYELEEIFHSPRQFRPNLRQIGHPHVSERARMSNLTKPPLSMIARTQSGQLESEAGCIEAESDLRAGRAVGVRNFANSLLIIFVTP